MSEEIRLAQIISSACFKDFIEIICPDFQISEHHLEMIGLIEQVINEPNGRGFIACPPRHSKSYLVSNLLPAFLMTTKPNFHVVVASYSAELSLELGRRTKYIIESPIYRKVFPHIGISQDSSSKTRFHLNNGSSFFAVGVGGSLVGRSASLLVLDDSYPGLEQARSKVYQDHLNNWYNGTFFTRRLPGAPLVIVNTLWTLGDLPLRLVKLEPERWKVLKLPAIKQDGTALWSKMFPIEELRRIKTSIGTQMFNALYQNDPSDQEGVVIKRAWLKFYAEKPTECEKIGVSADLTFKDTEKSDFVSMQVWGRKGANKYLLDQVYGRMGFNEQIAAFSALCAKWPQAQSKWVEEAANGAALIATLKGKIPGIIPVRPLGSKTARLEAIGPQFESGNVFFPDPALAPWIGDFIEEVCSFPSAPHDDRCDALSMAIAQISAGRTMNITPVSLTGMSKWTGRF